MQPFAAELSVKASQAVSIFCDCSKGAVLSTCQFMALSLILGFTKMSAFRMRMLGPKIDWTAEMMAGCVHIGMNQCHQALFRSDQG